MPEPEPKPTDDKFFMFCQHWGWLINIIWAFAAIWILESSGCDLSWLAK